MDTTEAWTVTPSGDAVQIGTRLFVASSNPEYPMPRAVARQIAALPQVVKALKEMVNLRQASLAGGGDVLNRELEIVAQAQAALVQISVLEPGQRWMRVRVPYTKARAMLEILQKAGWLGKITTDGFTIIEALVPRHHNDRLALVAFQCAMDNANIFPHEHGEIEDIRLSLNP